jgi:hypothetical protein
MRFPTMRPNGSNYVRPRPGETVGLTPPGFCWWRAAEREACLTGLSSCASELSTMCQP